MSAAEVISDLCGDPSIAEEVMIRNETRADITAEMRQGFGKSWHDIDREWAHGLADRIEAAEKREADSIELMVRDAIRSYSDLYVDAPSDNAERELKERAARGNAWLVAHGFAEEKVIWRRGETICL